MAGTHAIFNPEFSPPSPAVVTRADWPGTVFATALPEETSYQEVVRDWQGTFWLDRDRYQRRFYSVRTGGTRR